MSTGFRTDTGRWRGVWSAFLMDAALVWISFVAGIWLRFGELALEGLWTYALGLALGSTVMPCLFYVGGLYSPAGVDKEWLNRLRWLLGGLFAVLISMLVIGSVDFSSRIGRGVLAISFSILVPLVLLRHFRILKWRPIRWERILCLVTSEEDEAAAALLNHLWGRDTRYLGVVAGRDYQPKSALPVEGRIGPQEVTLTESRVDLLLVRDRHLADPLFAPTLRRLRYEGVEIVSLADACEEAYQAIPLGLVTESWLFRASHQPGLFYVRKMKRLFDIVAATFFLIVLCPFLLLGCLLVRLSSPGPVLFRQVRAGRMERPITVTKLRTMHVASERDAGAQWADTEDHRIFPAGAILRKFRIDEIPQLWNVLKGDMSFVGPRPEQSALIDHLNESIPYYRERLLVQPGLTGWAQVRYPYGASVEDAARKLEYDLYYMKHMSLFLDFFILLETVKIILCGGVRRGGDRVYSEFRESLLELARESGERPVPPPV